MVRPLPVIAVFTFNFATLPTTASMELLFDGNIHHSKGRDQYR